MRKKAVSYFQSFIKKMSLTHKISAVGIAFFIAVTVSLYWIQFNFLTKMSTQLIEMKEDYRVYTSALKKELNKQSHKSLMQDSKKKTEQTPSEQILSEALVTDFYYGWPLDVDEGSIVSSYNPTDQFVVVNRDKEHLKADATSFAEKYSLDDQVALLYDVPEWERSPIKKKKKPVSKKKKTERRIVGSSSRITTPRESYSEKGKFSFLWPIEQSKFWLSSLFGPRKLKNSGWRYHYGIDMAALRGTPVKAAASGIVLESGWHNGYGNYIMVAHNRKYKTRYAHLHRRKVKVGQKVSRGQVIGTVGDTGLVRKSGRDASHLHFEVHAFGRHVNPLSVLR